MICRKCIVSGRVQGVWYRGSTQREARRLGVTGSAINRPDGTVEVIACGAEEAVEQLQQWLWQGSEWAQVSAVSCEEVALITSAQFTTG